MDYALRPAYTDLYLGGIGRIDLQLIREILELNRNPQFDLGNGIARHRQPQADGKQQGNHLEPEIVNENALEKAALRKVRHGHSSLPGRRPASCLRASCELGGSSSIKLSSTELGNVGMGA